MHLNVVNLSISDTLNKPPEDIEDTKLQPPVAAVKPVQREYHGQVHTDDYGWLRSQCWLDVLRSPEALETPIREYLQSENDYCEAMLQPTVNLQKQLLAEMRGRIKEDDSEVPEKDGPYAYYWRYRSGEEHPVFARTPREGGEETILLDGELESQGKDYFELGDCEVSPDHRLLAWSCDDSGSEHYKMRIRDIESGCDLPEVIEDVESLGWATPDYLFYTRLDSAHRASEVFRHKPLSAASDDVLVMQESDERFSMSVGLFRCSTQFEISSSTDDQDEIWLLDTAYPEQEPKLVARRRPGHEYSVDILGDHLVILTNSGGATDFRFVTAPLATPGEDHWVELLAHQHGSLRQGLFVYRDFIVWLEESEALPQIRFMKSDVLQRAGTQSMQPDDEAIGNIEFEETAFELDIEPAPEYDGDIFRFVYSSPTTPATTYEYCLGSGNRQIIKQREIPSGHEPGSYQTQRLQVESKDGTAVPMTILYHRDTPLDGTAPCVLYGYGAYGASTSASFSSNRLSLVDRGFIYAIAHVRGGEENGRDWYLQTKGAGKQRSFDDFNACARYLASSTIADSKGIISFGGSAGGLLVAAAVNQEPHMYRGVVAAVPFVDVLNTMLDASLPLTPGEWSQWGNPIDDAQAFETINAYSPYDQVQANDYPAMLVTGSLFDPRVGYWEPAKWVAQLRRYKTDSNPLLFKTEMQGGHFGQSGRFGQLEDMALIYAFILWVTDKDSGGNSGRN